MKEAAHQLGMVVASVDAEGTAMADTQPRSEAKKSKNAGSKK